MEIYYWFWLAIEVIIIMFAIAKIVEALISNEEIDVIVDFLYLRFKNKWVQRVCRIAVTVICPLLYVVGMYFFFAVHELTLEHCIWVPYFAVLLFLLPFGVAIVLHDLVCFVKLFLDSEKKFLNWLW